jgi:undecaprenyl pyrophosphate phosphatase UppP
MERQTSRRNTLLKIVEFLIIPAVIIAGILFHLSQSLIIPLVVILALILGSVAIWAHANKSADGSEWWQDDDASGWRGY